MQTTLPFDAEARAAASRANIERIAGRRVIASVSGGRDSAAASLLLHELGIDHDRVFMDTGWEHPATYEYLRGPLTAALGPITEIRGERDLVQLVRHKGLFPSRVMRFCTTELKVLPIQRYLNARVDESGEIVNVVGIRRAESKARSTMAEWEWSDGFDCEVWRPLVDWTAADVAAIHARHGLETNPLYAMGATRVGCWPCIHARKSELALVARIDPDRIAQIEEIEADLNAAGAVRDEAKGRPFVVRSMFSYHGGDSKHFPMPIRQAVEWAESKRGEWQPPGAGDGCARHGMCAVESEEEQVIRQVSTSDGMTELAQKNGFIDGPEMLRLISEVNLSTADRLAAFERWKREDGTKEGLLLMSDDELWMPVYACGDCGHEMVNRCVKCGCERRGRLVRGVE